jgi:hypothetical protein
MTNSNDEKKGSSYVLRHICVEYQK